LERAVDEGTGYNDALPQHNTLSVFPLSFSFSLSHDTMIFQKVSRMIFLQLRLLCELASSRQGSAEPVSIHLVVQFEQKASMGRQCIIHVRLHVSFAC
jgi:hypothetical protein